MDFLLQKACFLCFFHRKIAVFLMFFMEKWHKNTVFEPFLGYKTHVILLFLVLFRPILGLKSVSTVSFVPHVPVKQYGDYAGLIIPVVAEVIF